MLSHLRTVLVLYGQLLDLDQKRLVILGQFVHLYIQLLLLIVTIADDRGLLGRGLYVSSQLINLGIKLSVQFQ